MRIEHDASRILSIRVGDALLARGWGVEFADDSAFFSLDRSCGYRYTVSDLQQQTSPNSISTKWIIRLKQGAVELNTRDEWENGKQLIRRFASVRCLETCFLMDFVLRFRFDLSAFHTATIDGKTYKHKASQVYNQFPTDSASVQGHATRAVVQITGHECGRAMAPYMYVRDAPGEWVVHARMLPQTADLKVIKLCSRTFGTRPLPRTVAATLLAIPGLERSLSYRGERRPYRSRVARIFSPNAYPLVRLRSGDVLAWTAECRFTESRYAHFRLPERERCVSV